MSGATNEGWMGVDLDGTLATYNPGQGIGNIGLPIEPMVKRVTEWLSKGYEVRIVTARVAAQGKTNGDGVLDSQEFADAQQEMIGDWTEKVFGVRLKATASKDFNMLQLWDDRCVQVLTNTGLAIEVTK